MARRRQLAAMLSTLHRGRRMEAFGERWTLAQPTGGRDMHDTLHAAVAATVRGARPRLWSQVHSWLPDCPAPAGEPPYGDYLPTNCGKADIGDANEVLQDCQVEHHKLLAFLVGVELCEPRRVFATFADRQRPFRLIAEAGRISGFQELAQTNGFKDQPAVV